MKRGLGASWLPRVGWEGFGKAKNKHEKGFGCFSWFPRAGWEGWKLLLLEIPLVDESDRCGTFVPPVSGLKNAPELKVMFSPMHFAKQFANIS